MKPSIAGNTVAFVLCGGLGYWLIHQPGGESPGTQRPAVTEVEATNSPDIETAKSLVNSQKSPALTESGRPEPGAEGGGLSDAIAWRRKLESMPLSEFPALFEHELLHAPDSVSISVLMEVWMDRDLDGHIAWLKTQPKTFAGSWRRPHPGDTRVCA